MTQNSSFQGKSVTTAQLAGYGPAPDINEPYISKSALTALNAPTPPKPSLPLPERFKDANMYKDAKDLSDKPLNKTVHPLYRTTNSEYGARPPESQELPNKYFGNAHEFTKQFAAGMTRNGSLNTSIQRSKIVGQPDPI